MAYNSVSKDTILTVIISGE